MRYSYYRYEMILLFVVAVFGAIVFVSHVVAATICGDPFAEDFRKIENKFCSSLSTSNSTPKVGETFSIRASIHLGGQSQALEFRSGALVSDSVLFSYDGHPTEMPPATPINTTNSCQIVSVRNGMSWFELIGGFGGYGDGYIEADIKCFTTGMKAFSGRIVNAPNVPSEGTNSITITVLPADSIPPTITITNTPTDIATWRDSAVDVHIDVTDDKALSKVQYSWDSETPYVVTFGSPTTTWSTDIKSPTAKQIGGHTLQVEAYDAAGNKATKTASPYKFNRCPKAIALNWIVDQNSINNFLDLTDKSSDGDGDPLTFNITNPVDHGTGGLNINSFSYTPTPGYIGPDSFTFALTDGICPGTQTPPADVPTIATVNITVRDVNEPPTCTPLAVTTPQNTPISIVLPGSDPDGDALTWTAATDSGTYHGTVGAVTGNTVTYTPGTNDTRTVSFRYTVKEASTTEKYSCDQGVTVTITANNRPVAVGARKTSTDAISSTVTIQEDETTPFRLEATDADSDELTICNTSSPAYGSLSPCTQSTHSGTSDYATITYTPQPDYAGPNVTLKFQANDTKSDSNETTITLQFTAVNDAPKCFDTSIIATEDSEYNGIGSAALRATDVDSATLTFLKASDPTKGTATVNADGTFTYTFTNTANATSPQSDSFTYRVSDGSANSSDCKITISGQPVNDKPTQPATATITSAANPQGINPGVNSVLTCSATPAAPSDPDGPTPVVYQYTFEKNVSGAWVPLRGWNTTAPYKCTGPDCAKGVQVRCGARGVDENGIGLAGDVRYSSAITILNSPPPASVCMSPANGAPNAATTQTMTWSQSADADGDTVTYQFKQCDTAVGGASCSPVAWGTATTTQSLSFGPLFAGRTYRWQINASDGTATTDSGACSFTTGVSANFDVTAEPVSSTTVPKNTKVEFKATVTAINGFSAPVTLTFNTFAGSTITYTPTSGSIVCSAYPGGKCEATFSAESSVLGTHQFSVTGSATGYTSKNSNDGGRGALSFKVWPKFIPTCSVSNATLSADYSGDISVWPPGFLLTPSSTYTLKVKPQDGYYVHSWGPSPAGMPADACTASGGTDASQTGAEKSCTLTMSDDRATCPNVKAKEGVTLILDPKISEAPVTTTGGGATSACQSKDGMTTITVTAKGEGAFNGPVDFSLEGTSSFISAGFSGPMRCTIATKGGTCATTIVAWVPTAVDHTFTVRAQNTASGINTTAIGTVQGRWHITSQANPADGNSDGIIDNTVTSTPTKLLYTQAEAVTVRANPGSGYAVQQFTGACTGAGTAVTGSSAKTCAVSMTCHQKVGADFIRDSGANFSITLRSPTRPYTVIGGTISGFTVDVTKTGGFSGDVTVQGESSTLFTADGSAGSIGVKFPDTATKICKGTENCSYPAVVYDSRTGPVVMMSGTIKVAGTSGTKREESGTQTVGFLPVVTISANPVNAGDIIEVSKLAGQILPERIGANGYMVTPPTILKISAQPRAGYRMTDKKYDASPGTCTNSTISGTGGYACEYKNPATTYPIDRNGSVTAQFAVDTASVSVSITRDTTRTQKLETDSNVIIPIGGVAYYTVTVKKDPTVTAPVNLSSVPVSGPGAPGIIGSLTCSFDANSECVKTFIVTGTDSGDTQAKVQATFGSTTINSNTVLTHVYETLSLTRDGVNGCSISQGATELLGALETYRWHLIPRGNITLTSTVSGAVFGGWKEGCTGTTSTCAITVPPTRSVKIQCNGASAPALSVSMTEVITTVTSGGTAVYRVTATRTSGAYTGVVSFGIIMSSRGSPSGLNADQNIIYPQYTTTWVPAPSCEITAGASSCSTELAIRADGGFGSRQFTASASATYSGTSYTATCSGCFANFYVNPTLTIDADSSKAVVVVTNPAQYTYNPYSQLWVNPGWVSPFPGYQVTSWTGCASGGDQPTNCYVSMTNNRTIIANLGTIPDLCKDTPSAVCSDPNNGAYHASGFARCVTIPFNGTGSTSPAPAINSAGQSWLDTRPSHNYKWANDTYYDGTCDNRSCVYRRTWSGGEGGAGTLTPSVSITEYSNDFACSYDRWKYCDANSVCYTWYNCSDYPGVPCESYGYNTWPYNISVNSCTPTQYQTVPDGPNVSNWTERQECRCNGNKSLTTMDVPPQCYQGATAGSSYPPLTFRCVPYPAFSVTASVSYTDISPYAYVMLSTPGGIWPQLGGCVTSVSVWQSINGGDWVTAAHTGNSHTMGLLYQEKPVKFKVRACSSSGCAEAISNEVVVNNPPLCPTVFGTTPVSSSANPLSPQNSAAVEFSYPVGAVIDPIIDPEGAGVTYQIKLVDPAGSAKNLTCTPIGSKKFSCSVNPSKYADLKYRNSSGTGPYRVYVDATDRTGRTRSSVGMSECNVGDIYTKIVADPTITMRAKKPGTTEIKDMAFVGDRDSVEYELDYSFATGAGIDSAIDTKIYIDLPVPASNVSSVSGGSADLSGNRMTLALGNVAPGASGEITFVLSIPTIPTDTSGLSTQAALVFDADCVSGGTSCALRVASATVALYRRTGQYFITTGGSIYSKSNISNLTDPNAIRKPIGLYYIISDGQVANIPVDYRARQRQYAGQQFGVPSATSSITKLGKLPIDDMITNPGASSVSCGSSYTATDFNYSCTRGKYDVVTITRCGTTASLAGVQCAPSEIFQAAGMGVASTTDTDTVTLDSNQGKVIVIKSPYGLQVGKHLILKNAPTGKSGATTVIIEGGPGGVDIFDDITYGDSMSNLNPKQVASVAWVLKNGNVNIFAGWGPPQNWTAANSCPGYKGSRWCGEWPEIRYLIEKKSRTITPAPATVSGIFYVSGADATTGIFYTGIPFNMTGYTSATESEIPLLIQGAVISRNVQFQRKKFSFD